jgi:hypothetical protein
LLAAASVAVSLSACDLLDPCGQLDLTGTQTRSFEQQGLTVIAVSDGAQVEIVRTCARPDCGIAELEVQSLSLGAPPDQLMLTASGRWLTYRIGSVVYRVDLDAPNLDTADPKTTVGTHGNIDDLIGSLRGGDWLIYRKHLTGAKTTRNSELWAVYVGDVDDLPEGQTAQEFQLGAGLDLRVVAMGHRHVVARHRLGDGREELYLIRVAPDLRTDYVREDLGTKLLLARGQAFRRVMITDGPSPAELRHSHDNVPTDAQVIATSGAGGDARTLIYSVADLTQIANFSGEVVTSVNALEDVTGLSPVSPDGSHLAYITARGELALRNLEDQTACMVRPASATRHVLAGFAADATMYFQAEQGGGEAVYAYQADTRVFTPLTNSDQKWVLQAVPPKRFDTDGEYEAYESQQAAVPWAIVRGNNELAASRPVESPSTLSYQQKPSFLPHGDETLWLLEAKQETHDTSSRLDLRRIQPVVNNTVLGFDTTDADPTVCEGASCNAPLPYSHEYSSIATTVCVSVSQSAIHTTPWATQCSAPDNPKRYLDTGPPVAELGP